MTNHVTEDGLLAVDECKRTIRYRDQDAEGSQLPTLDGSRLILQDTCLPEPRIQLTTLVDHADQYSTVTLDVRRATALYKALGAFLNDSRGQTGWQYGGVVYDLNKAWEGRPGTDYAGLWFRHTGDFVKGLPWMRAEPTPGNTYHVPLPVLLGLEKCPVHKIWSEPCHACALGWEAGRAEMWPEDNQ